MAHPCGLTTLPPGCRLTRLGGGLGVAQKQLGPERVAVLELEIVAFGKLPRPVRARQRPPCATSSSRGADRPPPPARRRSGRRACRACRRASRRRPRPSGSSRPGARAARPAPVAGHPGWHCAPASGRFRQRALILPRNSAMRTARTSACRGADPRSRFPEPRLRILRPAQHQTDVRPGSAAEPLGQAGGQTPPCEQHEVAGLELAQQSAHPRSSSPVSRPAQRQPRLRAALSFGIATAHLGVLSAFKMSAQ